MPIINFYNEHGLGHYSPGNLTASDSTQVEGILPYGLPLYAVTELAGNTFVVNTTTPFSLTISATGEVYSGFVKVGSVLNTDRVVDQLNQLLPNLHTVSFNPVSGLYIFVTAIPGVAGLFSINGTSNTGVPTNPGVLRAGRLVVPDSTLDLAVGLRIANTPYRYPVLGDTAETLMGAVLIVKDGHTNYTRQPLMFSVSQVTPGTPFAGLQRGTMVIQPISIINSATPLYVETNTAGDLAGRITAVTTATALALPVGKLHVVSANLAADQLARVRIY